MTDARDTSYNEKAEKGYKVLVKADASKEHESETIEGIFDAVNRSSYLGSFFSYPMVSELQYRMRNDLPCNIWEEYKHFKEEAASLNRELVKTQAELHQSRATLASHVKESAAVVAAYEGQIAELGKKLEESEANYLSMVQQLTRGFNVFTAFVGVIARRTLGAQMFSEKLDAVRLFAVAREAHRQMYYATARDESVRTPDAQIADFFKDLATTKARPGLPGYDEQEALESIRGNW